MCFACCQLSGFDFGLPDVCLTPPVPVPVPYLNVAAGMTAIPNVTNILVLGMPQHNMGTKIPFSNGDNPGVSLGVASGSVMGPAQPVANCAYTVIVKGMPASRMGTVSIQNRTNLPGVRGTPSQGRVLVPAA